MHGGVAGRSVLLTGAGGSLGSALAKAIIQLEPQQLILIDHSERNLHEIDSELTAALPGVPRISVLGDICHAAFYPKSLTAITLKLCTTRRRSSMFRSWRVTRLLPFGTTP